MLCSAFHSLFPQALFFTPPLLTGSLISLNTPSWQCQAHPSTPGIYKLSEYEIVTPTRVNEFGEPFPTDVHFRRRRRSTSAASPDAWTAAAAAASPKAHYKLSAFGQQFLFNLTASSAFIAPLFTVSLLGEPAADQRRLYAEAADADVKHCFYRGHVNARPRHTAVISLCSGMLGTFKSDDGDYFVEPLLSLEEQEYEEEHNKPHLVYRHRTPPTNSSGDRQTCDTPGIHFVTAVDDLKSHRRTKRFLSYPRFVEVMVVADSRMVAYHGANLQHYVLTLMSIVASIYKDPSIGNLINIVIVKLVVIHNEQDGPAISYNAQTTLKNFCQWQQSQNHPEGSHLQHDTAVLVTRQDICRAHDKCDTLGLAELGTVCDPYRSCSISEDNGLSTAFTIAHELGHVFNMPHDDNHKCKEDGGKNQQHVMAPTLNFYTNPWMWSKCSRKYITEFLDTGYGECLLDEPSSRTYTLPQQLPGLIYDVNKQCELIFGPGSQVCPYMMQCRRLWCINIDGAHKGCRTQHTPWADGTECEPGKHCRFGMCVPKEREAPVIDGAWGTWSPFGTCSRTCGGGIKTAIRECNRPEPKNGGKYCVGRRMKFKSCNTEPCSKLKKDFRDEQCADFDGKHFNINGLPTNVRWVPKYSGILMKDRCKLFCRVAGNTAYYQLRDRVIDGTPCGPDTNDICVQGLCRQAGCDHVLNSKARRDKCGVCGGDNSSCKTIAGTFNTVHYGYNVVVRIPAGATNIDVRQHSYSGKPEDDNYLALSNSQGDFILNGDFVVSMFKREIKVGNAVIEYSGSDNTIERINSTDRIEQEITLQVLSVGNLYNPDVRYTFNIPIEDKPQQFYWNAYGPWQPCSKLCQGERKRKPVCTRESDQLTVSDQRCDRIPQPEPITEPCSTECELRWHIARKSECTAQCGLGYRTLEIYCSKYSRLEGKIEKVDDRFCSSQPKPSTREKCTGDCNVGGWRYSAWTECSKSCGGGTRRRRAMCVNTYNDVLDDSKCSQQEKLTVQRCSDFSCPQWKAGDWSECLVTCGKGHKHRQTWCQFGEDRLNDRFCDPETKPESVQTCQQQECASWQVGPWGQCSATCGKGTRMRYVSCRDDQGSVADESACFHLPKPSATEMCTVTPCGQWKALEWSSVSITLSLAGEPYRPRCRKRVSLICHACPFITGELKVFCCLLLAIAVCPIFKAGNVTVSPFPTVMQCSVTCGQGKATRQVICINYSDQLVDRSECDPDDLPATEQDCSMSPCHPNSHDYGRPIHPFLYPDHRLKLHPGGSPNRNRAHIPGGNQWRIGPWGACSSTCAGGFQRRVVVCQDENGYTANNCDEKSKPMEQRSCESGPCPQWAYGNWGECTKPCGAGTRTRLVVCQRPNGERFTDLSCEILDKPPDREQCNVQDCPRDAAWSAGPWSSCSVSCGRGQKHRNVYCLSKEGRHIEEDYCKHLAKPNVQKKCRGGRCPKWKAGDWGQCSVSCGRGVQRRTVQCQGGTPKAAEEAECDPAGRPPPQRDCHLPECPTHRWAAGEWQACMKTCGEASRYRKVVCVDENKQVQNSGYCDASKRPPEMESCGLPPCEYVWITGEWSEVSPHPRPLTGTAPLSTGPPSPSLAAGLAEILQPKSTVAGQCCCSVTCGVGVMHRSVQCLTNTDQVSSLCHADLKPEERRTCHNVHDCKSADLHLPFCKDVKDLKGVTEDGEYFVQVKGKMLKVYCSGMQTDSPKEYVTLVNGDAENFSEVYGYRLHNPTECPYNGSRREDCQCRKDYTAAGFSTFSKVRLDLNTMQIITTDLQFARTHDGRPVPYATAGDCYSAAKCPQGRFSIDLYGTGLSLAGTAKWLSQGNYAVSEIQKSPDGTKVVGKCGGHCGKCTPSSGTGLDVQVL
uniref:ADAM metallopeptidase with thrombospondin type 1 motif 9 n=1 Tax=Calidris pygmaea TaxID=425635 RepID=A0A8C3JV51_9CHAR